MLYIYLVPLGLGCKKNSRHMPIKQNLGVHLLRVLLKISDKQPHPFLSGSSPTPSPFPTTCHVSYATLKHHILSLSVQRLAKLMTGNKNFRISQRHLNLKPRKKKRIFFQKRNAFKNSWKIARTLRNVLLNIHRQEVKWKRKVRALWRK